MKRLLRAAEQDGVKQQLERPPGLRPVLRAEAEEHDMAFAQTNINQR